MTTEKKRELLGHVAAVCTTGSLVWGAIALWRMYPKPALGVDLTMYIVINIGIAMWFAFGLWAKSRPVWIANGVALPFTMAILVYKLLCG